MMIHPCDGQTDGFAIAYSALSMLSHAKKVNKHQYDKIRLSVVQITRTIETTQPQDSTTTRITTK